MFAYRLAIQCGYPHPRLMLEKMTTRELREMMAYASIEPFGEVRQEIRHGQLMQKIDAANFKRDKPLAPIDFMNFIEKPKPKEPKKLTPDEMQKKVDKEIFGL